MNFVSLRTLFLVLSLLLVPSICTCVRAQTDLLDSLKNAIQTETDPLRRIDLHNGVVRLCMFYGDFEQGRNNLDVMLKLSRKSGYVAGEFQALMMMGNYESEEGDSTSADYYAEAVKLAQTSENPRLLRSIDYNRLDNLLIAGHLAEAGDLFLALKADYPPQTPGQQAGLLVYEGDLAEMAGDDSLALAAYLGALPLYDEHSRQPPLVPELGRPSVLNTTIPYMNQAKLLVELGRIAVEIGDVNAALDYFGQAKALFSDAQADAFVGWTLFDIVELHQESGDMENAVSAGREAIKIFERLGRDSDLADAYLQLGVLYYDQNDFTTAITFLEKSYAIGGTLTDQTLVWDIHETLAAAYNSSGQAEKGRKFLEKGIALARKSKDVTLVGPALYNLGLNLYLQQYFEASIPYFLEARDVAGEMNRVGELFVANYQLSKTYLALGILDSANFYLEEARQVPDEKMIIAHAWEGALLASEIAEKAQDYRTALLEHKAYVSHLQQMFSGAAQGKLKAEQVRQNVNEITEQKALAEQQAELLRQRNQLYLLLALVLLGILVLAAYAYRQVQKVKQQLEVKNQELEQLNATKDKFFSIIAHDIRSPIVALDGVGEQMSYYLEKGKTDKLERLADQVGSTAKRLSSLLDNLLNWALLQQGVIPYRPKAIDIAETGSHVFDMFRSNAELKNISLDLKVEGGLKVHADEAALQTILRNLVSNAIKFTPGGGKVSIGTESKGDKVFITVNDTGTGISAAKMKQLFTLGRNSEPGTAGEKGTGLGLTLVKELAELNKGSLAVSSEPLRGSEFRVGLPLAA